MRLGDLLELLKSYDADSDVEIDQFFRDNKSVKIRSVKAEGKKIILMDHHTTFQTRTVYLNGVQFEMNPFEARLTRVFEIDAA